MEGYVPHGTRACAPGHRERTPRIRIYVYIAKGLFFAEFSETLGMMSDARGSRTGNTDFSIARILANDSPSNIEVAWKLSEESPERDLPQRETEATKRTPEPRRVDEMRFDAPVITERSGDHDSGNVTRPTDLMWLQYTRYRPPRLPRRSFPERRVKRRAGDHPRIPFSSSQLQVLEDRYQKSAYLSRNDVVEMSATLRLPQSKIKIWFQNRRARQRRESLNSIITAR
ncbi:hypothetical protein PUN28_005579 [Cardiocondyla obscurior]